MAVPSESPVNSSVANGVTTSFPYTFTLLSDSDMVVKVTDTSGVESVKTLGVDYTLSGGAVVFTVAPASGYIVTRYRDSALARTTDYQNNGDILAATVNADFDRLWYALQEIFNGGKSVPNSLRAPSGETLNALPVALSRAGYYLGFDGSGQPALLLAASGTAAALASDLSDSSNTAKGDALMATKQAGTGATARTQHLRNADQWLLTDFGGIVADGTDQTAAIEAWLGSLTSTASGLYIIPYNCRFVVPTVIAAMPYGLAFLDLSGFNDYSSAGETSKCFGLLSKDKAESDTHWRIGSSHHTVLNLNNYGGAGTVSAGQRKASILWSAGQFSLGSTDKRGFRGAAIKQFTQETSATYWIESLRSLAPWTAISGTYEEWATGQTISGAGVYRFSGNNHYVSTGAGTTGATAPTHTTGTVTDGGVSWTWLDSIDRTVYSVDQYGRWLIGAGTAGATFRHKVTSTDPSQNYRMELVANGASGKVLLRGFPTTSGGAESNLPYLQWEDGLGLRFMKSDGSQDMGSLTDNGWRVSLEATTTSAPTVASASTTTVTTRVAFISGTTAIATLTVPTAFASSGGQLTLIPTGAFTTTTAGNIALASTAVVNKALIMTYDSVTNKFYPSY
jgi:hypothetical protein